MKKVCALLLAVILLLTGCGQAPSQNAENQEKETTAQPREETAAPETETPTEEELYVVDLQWEGMTVKDYYQGGEDGILVKTEWWADDGRYGVQTFWDNGMMKTSISYDLDGSVFEDECYYNGTSKISIYRQPDGTVQENHYADDGIVEYTEEYINFTPGTEVYSKTVNAEGVMVQEMIRNEDGTRKEWALDEEGSTWEVYYSVDGFMTKMIINDPVYDWYSVTEYYIDGSRKRQEDTNGDGSQYRLYEFYADGKEKHWVVVNADGTKQEHQYNYEGVLTYCYSKNLVDEVEFVGNDAGELIKYTENGTVYEGDQIPENAKLSFRYMQQSN